MKTEYNLKYGRETRSVYIDEGADVCVFRPRQLPAIEDLDKELDRALDGPLDAVPLQKMPQPRSVAIAVPDKSRPLPVNSLLPPLLERIRQAWLDLSSPNINVIVGGGLHPPLSEAELAETVSPAVKQKYPVTAHGADGDELVSLGLTSRGTPVTINSRFAEADFKVVLGQTDPHQFVGMTGGAKGAIIGCGARQTIEKNHGLMFRPGAIVGRLSGNPVREDINEAGKIAGIDFCVNAVMNADNRPARLYAGAQDAVLEASAALCASVYGHEIDELCDVAVASCGGHPKDICLYQAQKGLNLASMAVRPGGKILLLACCEEGVGDDAYYEYACRFASAEDAMEDFTSGEFKMGAHKSYLFGLTLTRFEVVLCSDLDYETLARCHIKKGEAQQVVDTFINEQPAGTKVAVVPAANTTYFYYK
jgi:nickel-dependent lactate racemase